MKTKPGFAGEDTRIERVISSFPVFEIPSSSSVNEALAERHEAFTQNHKAWVEAQSARFEAYGLWYEDLRVW